jgi:EAL domain-containing protein (putative c-di-GMP-specific phosphodiesterase class I)
MKVSEWIDELAREESKINILSGIINSSHSTNKTVVNECVTEDRND